jgi:hypothetical protein
LVKRSELARLNKQGFSNQPLELRETHIAIVKLDVKVLEIKKNTRKSLECSASDY